MIVAQKQTTSLACRKNLPQLNDDGRFCPGIASKSTPESGKDADETGFELHGIRLNCLNQYLLRSRKCMEKFCRTRQIIDA